MLLRPLTICVNYINYSLSYFKNVWLRGPLLFSTHLPQFACFTKPIHRSLFLKLHLSPEVLYIMSQPMYHHRHFVNENITQVQYLYAMVHWYFRTFSISKNLYLFYHYFKAKFSFVIYFSICIRNKP